MKKYDVKHRGELFTLVVCSPDPSVWMQRFQIDWPESGADRHVAMLRRALVFRLAAWCSEHEYETTVNSRWATVDVTYECEEHREALLQSVALWVKTTKPAPSRRLLKRKGKKQ